jgi:hypothetical protein
MAIIANEIKNTAVTSSLQKYNITKLKSVLKSPDKLGSYNEVK